MQKFTNVEERPGKARCARLAHVVGLYLYTGVLVEDWGNTCAGRLIVVWKKEEGCALARGAGNHGRVSRGSFAECSPVVHRRDS